MPTVQIIKYTNGSKLCSQNNILRQHKTYIYIQYLLVCSPLPNFI